jgi:hypothetical protein
MNSKIQLAVAAATRTAYEHSFRTVFLVSLAFGLLSVISSWFSPNVEKHMTNFLNTKVDGTQWKVSEDKSDPERDEKV